MAGPLPFDDCFHALMKREPFGWQRRLYAKVVAGCIPAAVDIPTGLGKTAVIAIWLIALAEQARTGPATLPRRLVYVVDRRTVVDQATDIAMDLRQALREREAAGVAAGLSILSGSADPERLLAISTLRGEYADNKEWQHDPARAAIIVGTVDMIGSRLLFSGYGATRKMRPFHAGLLGQDALIVHDEAHLSPAFGKLISDIAKLQKEGAEPRPIRVMELSATQRGKAAAPESPAEDCRAFSLTDEDRAEQAVAQRLNAPKRLRLHLPEAGARLEDELAKQAFEFEEKRARVVVYVRSPETAKAVAAALEKPRGAQGRVATLTGTIRGHERDQMTMASPTEIADAAARRRAEIFQGFRAKPGREPPAETEYLVATSAGEVGVDLDADHMVSDLTTLDSMIQRLGRVNRLGEGNAEVVVVDMPPEKTKGEDGTQANDYEQRVAATRQALESLPDMGEGARDVGPQAMQTLVEGLGADEIERCFSKMPTMVELTDILLDAWSMTCVEELPGRPPVERWLHGIGASPPSVFVAWREELDELADSTDRDVLKKLFDKHPILARERLRGNRSDVVEELKAVAKRLDRKVVLLPPRGDPVLEHLAELLKKENADRLREATIVLPPGAGGLDGQGMLDGSVKDRVPDVADAADVTASTDAGPSPGASRRRRVLVRWNDEAGAWEEKPLGGGEGWRPLEAPALRRALAEARETHREMVEKARVVLERDAEGAETKVLLLLTRRGSLDAAEDSQEAARREPVLLSDHNRDVAREAAEIARRLGLPDELQRALRLAGAHHDPGKDRAGWQKAIGHPRPHGELGDWVPWAKSVGRGFDDSACGRYRHEFGSLRQALLVPEIASDVECDLILHAIASHHGWARPHFNEDQWDIEEGGFDENPDVAAQVPRRFARLQRRFGRWGLAWLESLLRAADYRVSSGRAGVDEKDERKVEEPVKEETA